MCLKLRKKNSDLGNKEETYKETDASIIIAKTIPVIFKIKADQ